ncbi:MAG: F0F1 ATP synthase subunit A [Erysipelotrichaceae bacterium]|nr:F0F1 ATP synthase subunit A [Erysipelotrichaceae bacterium]MDP3305310.1 F0F1 ATP synthase subunit A [Erysipelotrichaceae bacterium]
MTVGLQIQLQVEVFSILIVTAIILMLIYIVNRAVVRADPLQKPTGIVLLGVLYVQMMTSVTQGNMGVKAAQAYTPYIGSLALYLFISNISGLFGLAPPTANYSVTLTLALITFIMIQRTVYITGGLKQFFHRFIEPYPPFIVMNIFGTFAPLISMSLRLFGNITSGGIIMALLYTFTGYVSHILIGFIPVLGQFDFIGPIIAPALHAYFDVFVGFIQMFVFISLTTVFIGNELPVEE